MLVLCLNSQGQNGISPTFYTCEFFAKITRIDTVILVKDDYAVTTSIPLNNFKALCINFKITSKGKGNFKNVNKFIVMELSKNENNCTYKFTVGKTYKIYGIVERYSSVSIKKKYRKKFIKLDCYNLPVMQ